VTNERQLAAAESLLAEGLGDEASGEGRLKRRQRTALEEPSATGDPKKAPRACA